MPSKPPLVKPMPNGASITLTTADWVEIVVALNEAAKARPNILALRRKVRCHVAAEAACDSYAPTDSYERMFPVHDVGDQREVDDA